MKFKKGDKVEFIFGDNKTKIPTYYTDSDGIPRKLIIHGNTDVGEGYKLHKAKIVDKYKEFFMVEFDDDTNEKVRLGFKAESLMLVGSRQGKPTHIILCDNNQYHIAYGRKSRDETIKKLVDNKEVDNDCIMVFDIKNQSKVVCNVIVEEIK